MSTTIDISPSLSQELYHSEYIKSRNCRCLTRFEAFISVSGSFCYALAAAPATIISQAVSSVWVLIFLSGRKTVLKIQQKIFRFNGRVIFPVLALVISHFIMAATENIFNIAFTHPSNLYSPSFLKIRSLQSFSQNLSQMRSLFLLQARCSFSILKKSSAKHQPMLHAKKRRASALLFLF